MAPQEYSFISQRYHLAEITYIRIDIDFSLVGWSICLYMCLIFKLNRHLDNILCIDWSIGQVVKTWIFFKQFSNYKSFLCLLVKNLKTILIEQIFLIATL